MSFIQDMIAKGKVCSDVVATFCYNQSPHSSSPRLKIWFNHQNYNPSSVGLIKSVAFIFVKNTTFVKLSPCPKRGLSTEVILKWSGTKQSVKYHLRCCSAREFGKSLNVVDERRILSLRWIKTKPSTCQCHRSLHDLPGYEINLLHTFRRLHIRSTSVEIWWGDLPLSWKREPKWLTTGSDEGYCTEAVGPISTAVQSVGGQNGQCV